MIRETWIMAVIGIMSLFELVNHYQETAHIDAMSATFVSLAVVYFTSILLERHEKESE